MLDCKTVVFSYKTRFFNAKTAGAATEVAHTCRSSVSFTVFSLSPDLSFDCSCVVDYVKIRIFLQPILFHPFETMRFKSNDVNDDDGNDRQIMLPSSTEESPK